ATRGSDQGEHLALVDLEAHLLHGRLAAVGDAEQLGAHALLDLAALRLTLPRGGEQAAGRRFHGARDTPAVLGRRDRCRLLVDDDASDGWRGLQRAHESLLFPDKRSTMKFIRITITSSTNAAAYALVGELPSPAGELA